MKTEDFELITTYRCKKCGQLVDIPEIHMCKVFDTTSCVTQPMIRYTINTYNTVGQ